MYTSILFDEAYSMDEEKYLYVNDTFGIMIEYLLTSQSYMQLVDFPDFELENDLFELIETIKNKENIECF